MNEKYKDVFEEDRIYLTDIYFNNYTKYCLCGYCGNFLIETSGIGKYTTYGSSLNCIYFYGFSIAAAENSKKNGPSTNRPVICSVCNLVFWFYNLKLHFAEKHPMICVQGINEKEIALVSNFKKILNIYIFLNITFK